MALSKKTKSKIIYSIIAGLIFAGAMHLLDVYNDKAFNLNAFIYNFLIFSVLLGVKEVYLYNKRKKNNNKEQ